MILEASYFWIVWECLGNSCNSNISSNILPNGKSTWKLCINTYDRSLQLKIKSLFLVSSKFPEWITIGFPLNGLNTDNYDISFFLLEVTGPKSYNVKQTKEVKKLMNCSIPEKARLKLISVVCNLGETMEKYVNSKKITVFWKTGTGSANISKAEENLVKSHSVLYFYPRPGHREPDENAGSTAMRLLRSYGKSMAAIFGISFLLTALITLTICCCCKKKRPAHFSKATLHKETPVSFYRDDSEGDGQSDGESDHDEDEKVAFIRNNNERNSEV